MILWVFRKQTTKYLTHLCSLLQSYHKYYTRVKVKVFGRVKGTSLLLEILNCIFQKVLTLPGDAESFKTNDAAFSEWKALQMLYR
jgi:hypothetical protein